MEPYPRSLCHQLHGQRLVDCDRCLLQVPLYLPDKLNIHPGHKHVARGRHRSVRIPSYNCVRQRNNVQFCRVSAMVPPERHQTLDWRSLPSGHQKRRRKCGTVFQAVTGKVEDATTTSTTGFSDAVSPYIALHRFSPSQLLNGR